MEDYVCRGSVKAINADGNGIFFLLAAKTQFDCGKNGIENQKGKYNILYGEKMQNRNFEGISEKEWISVSSNKNGFLPLLQMAYEEEATFTISKNHNGSWNLVSITVGRTDV